MQDSTITERLRALQKIRESDNSVTEKMDVAAGAALDLAAREAHGPAADQLSRTLPSETTLEPVPRDVFEGIFFSLPGNIEPFCTLLVLLTLTWLMGYLIAGQVTEVRKSKGLLLPLGKSLWIFTSLSYLWLMLWAQIPDALLLPRDWGAALAALLGVLSSLKQVKVRITEFRKESREYRQAKMAVEMHMKNSSEPKKTGEEKGSV